MDKTNLKDSSSTLGILDLSNMSDFNITGTTKQDFKDFLSQTRETSKLNSNAAFKSIKIEKSTMDENFKVPDSSTTNALLSKRFFPQTFRNSYTKNNNSTQSQTNRLTETIDASLDSMCFKMASQSEWRFTDSVEEDNSNLRKSVSGSSLDSKLFRQCSDSEWRYSSEGLGVRNFTGENATSFLNIYPNKQGYTTPRVSVSKDELPTPFKQNQSIIGRNKSTDEIDVGNTTMPDFRTDQISARSSSLSGSGSGTLAASSSVNPSSNTLGTTIAGPNSTCTSAKQSFMPVARNPFDSVSWQPPENFDLGFPNSFGKELPQPADISMEDFFSGGDAMKIIQEGELQFQNENELMLPENLSNAAQGSSFATYKDDLSTVTRPSFCNTSVFSTSSEVPDRITKDILFKAKSNPLGKIFKRPNTVRPNFGTDIESPARSETTVYEEHALNGSESTQNEKSAHAKYISELMQNLSIDTQTRKQSDNGSTSKDPIPSPAQSLPTLQLNNQDIRFTRSHSASDVDFYGQAERVRKCHSAENISPRKNRLLAQSQYYGSQPHLEQRNIDAKGNTSYGFCPTHFTPVHMYGCATPQCIQCYESTRMNAVTSQMHMHQNCPTLHCPMTRTPLSYHDAFQPFQPNEIIRGPTELSLGHICLGSNAKANIPLINPSNRVLNCNFSIVTAFMSNTKVKPESLGLILPGASDIPPRSMKESSVSFTAVEEGPINLWVEISTSVPYNNTTLGSFVCHITLTTEYPKIKIDATLEKTSKCVLFNVPSPNDEINVQFITIENQGKATVPLIVYLQNENSNDEFTFTFPESKIQEIMSKSNHIYQILNHTIVLYHIQGDNSGPILVPITITKRKGLGSNSRTIKGYLTVGLQCLNKADTDLEKISLLALIGFQGTLSAPLGHFRSHHGEESILGVKKDIKRTSRLVNQTAQSSINLSTYDIPERDTRTLNNSSKCDYTVLAEDKWGVEPANLVFTKQKPEQCFKVYNKSDNLFWFQIAFPTGVFSIEPHQGLCMQKSSVTMRVKILSPDVRNKMEDIRITCDGFDKIVTTVFQPST